MERGNYARHHSEVKRSSPLPKRISAGRGAGGEAAGLSLYLTFWLQDVLRTLSTRTNIDRVEVRRRVLPWNRDFSSGFCSTSTTKVRRNRRTDAPASAALSRIFNIGRRWTNTLIDRKRRTRSAMHNREREMISRKIWETR